METKKVIEVIKQDALPTCNIDIEVVQFEKGISLLHYNEASTDEVYILNENRTTTAKAICPKYQQVEDENIELKERNAKLLEQQNEILKALDSDNYHEAKRIILKP